MLLLFPNVPRWRIPQVGVHERIVNPKKISEFTILREGYGGSGDLGMNFIDVCGWTFDHNIDNEQPESLLRTSRPCKRPAS